MRKKKSRSARATSAGSSPTVLIFGATVAGLTAAQRLAERGFRVTVLREGGDPRMPQDLEGVPWARPSHIQAFYSRGPTFRSSSPLPPRALAPPLLHHFRHLRSLLADIPVASSSTARPRRTKKKNVSNVLSMATPRTWRPSHVQDQPWVLFGTPRPQTTEQFIEGAKNFLTAGYAIPDGQTFVARVLRFLTSSEQRRTAECEDVTMLDYLRGASRASAPRFSYGPRFSDELQGIAELSLAIRPSRDEARVALGWYAQWLADSTVAPQDGSFEFPGGVGDGWTRPWLAHLRRLKVRILQGTLEHLELGDARSANGAGPRQVPSKKNGRKKTPVSPTVRAVLATGCDPAARALSKEARYLLVATGPRRAERACLGLPAVGVPAALRGFTTSEPAGRSRWQRQGEIHLFLPVAMNMPGPLVVAGSTWGLVARPQRPFNPRPPSVKRDGFAGVLAVEIHDWDVPSPTTNKCAAACDDRELAHEVWSQLLPALTAGHSRSPPVWFMVPLRPGWRNEEEQQGRSPTLNVLPGDWTRRPGPTPRATPHEATPSGSPVWSSASAEGKGGGSWLHWDRLLFAGDYLKTLTRYPGPEAACESGLHAVNTLLAHATQDGTAAATPPCQMWDPEDHEPPAFSALRALDAWCFEQRLPHIFEITGLDGWLGVASWLSHLSPATESFLKSVVDLGRSFPGTPGAAAAGSTPAPERTSLQQLGLDVLRRMREALESRKHPLVTSSGDTPS